MPIIKLRKTINKQIIYDAGNVSFIENIMCFERIYNSQFCLLLFF